jgi:hypothetical protein
MSFMSLKSAPESSHSFSAPLRPNSTGPDSYARKGQLVASSSFAASASWSRFDCLGIRGHFSPDRRSRKAREVRLHLLEDE